MKVCGELTCEYTLLIESSASVSFNMTRNSTPSVASPLTKQYCRTRKQE